MGDQVAEEDPYSDDDLDALPDSAFDELQENAFRSTQPALQHASSRLPAFKSPHRPSNATLAGGFGRLSVVGDTLPGRQHDGAQQASSDYGDLDDEMLDGEIYEANGQQTLSTTLQPSPYKNRHPGESSQREAWRQQRYSHSMQYISKQSSGARAAQTFQEPLQPPNGLNNGSLPSALPSSKANPGLSKDQDAIDVQNEIRKLMLEKVELQRAVKIANERASLRDGEISIVRANAAKMQAEYNRDKEAERQYLEVEANKAKDQLAMVKRELEEMTTNNQFLQRDVVNGAQEMRRLRASKASDKSIYTKGLQGKTGATTPRKHRSSLGDGFNDDEIQPLSPSRLVYREKSVGTPKVGSKRKRKATQDSPTKQSLQLDQQPQGDSFDESDTIPLAVDEPEPAPLPTGSQDRNLVFVQKFLDHRFPGSEQRTIEVLANYAFPSNPGKPFSTMLLDKLSPIHIRPDTENIPATVALEVVSLWAHSIQEKYHQPIHLLLDQVRFILTLHPFKTAPELTNNLMALLQETADILIIPRCQKKPPRSDRAQLSSMDCLEVIQIMASQLSISLDEAIRFWRTMRFDFIMMLLSFIHPIQEMSLIIRTLHTSILPNSFAMIIPPNDGKQDVTEGKVLENLSRLLVEPPRPNQGEPALSEIELADLRLSIIALLEDMSVNDYAALAICRHKLVLGRLVRLMNDSLTYAYCYPPSHSQLIEIVNSATRLLYYFLNNFAPEHINMQQKLSVIPGGEKKLLIVLTRLAFSEGVFLEEGIEDDVVDIAHRMLEDRVSPEEAEGLMNVMSTAPSTRSAPTRRESKDEGANERDENESGESTTDESSDTSDE